MLEIPQAPDGYTDGSVLIVRDLNDPSDGWALPVGSEQDLPPEVYFLENKEILIAALECPAEWYGMGSGDQRGLRPLGAGEQGTKLPLFGVKRFGSTGFVDYENAPDKAYLESPVGLELTTELPAPFERLTLESPISTLKFRATDFDCHQMIGAIDLEGGGSRVLMIDSVGGDLIKRRDCRNRVLDVSLANDGTVLVGGGEGAYRLENCDEPEVSPFIVDGRFVDGSSDEFATLRKDDGPAIVRLADQPDGCTARLATQLVALEKKADRLVAITNLGWTEFLSPGRCMYTPWPDKPDVGEPHTEIGSVEFTDDSVLLGTRDGVREAPPGSNWYTNPDALSLVWSSSEASRSSLPADVFTYLGVAYGSHGLELASLVQGTSLSAPIHLTHPIFQFRGTIIGTGDNGSLAVTSVFQPKEQ